MHGAKTESHPIADMVIARCSCGWIERFSVYEFDNPGRAASDAARRHNQAALEIVPLDGE